MNKIFIEDIETKDLNLKEDTVLVFDKYNDSINITAEHNIKIFALILFSKANINYQTSFNTTFNIFTVDSSCIIDIDLNKDNILFNYNYSTININDNDYKIDIRHLNNNITSKITNHGINTSNNRLSFTINTIVPKNSNNIKTNQDSKIIVLRDNNCTIKPNLLIDNDDIEAEHAAYIGRFKDDEIFYLMTRGIKKDDAIDLLVKSFLIEKMDITGEEKELIIDNIKQYWR